MSVDLHFLLKYFLGERGLGAGEEPEEMLFKLEITTASAFRCHHFEQAVLSTQSLEDVPGVLELPVDVQLDLWPLLLQERKPFWARPGHFGGCLLWPSRCLPGSRSARTSRPELKQY